MITDEQALYFYRHPSAKRFVMSLDKYFWDNRKSREDNLIAWIKKISKTAQDGKKFIKLLSEPHILNTDTEPVDLDDYARNGTPYPEDIAYIENNNLVWEVMTAGTCDGIRTHCCLIYNTPHGLRHKIFHRYGGNCKIVYTELVGILEGDHEKVTYLKTPENIFGRLYRESKSGDVFIKM